MQQPPLAAREIERLRQSKNRVSSVGALGFQFVSAPFAPIFALSRFASPPSAVSRPRTAREAGARQRLLPRVAPSTTAPPGALDVPVRVSALVSARPGIPIIGESFRSARAPER